ncbi:MAG: ComEC/Rec2 family competence protein [Oscillospiraceae bacterium]
MDKNTKALLSLPAVRFAPFFAAGLLAGYYFLSVWILIIVAAGLFAVSMIKFRKAAVQAAGLLAGLLVMSLYSALYIAPITEYGGKTVRGELYIEEISSNSQNTQRVVAEINLGGRKTSVRVTGQIGAFVGDIVTADITLSLPPEKYRSAELANGVLLYGTAENVSRTSRRLSLKTAIAFLRKYCISNVKSCFDGDMEAVLLSMMFGDSSQLTARLEDAFAVSGTSHFTVVSGTHFTIFAAILPELLFKKKKRVGALISVALVPLGILFFGAAPSVLRAGIMLLILNSAPLFCRRSECLNSLCVAAAAIMLFSPLTALDAGFAMSVLGVFGAAVVGPRISAVLCRRINRPIIKKAAGAFVISACAVICTAPVSVSLFGGISLVGALLAPILLPFLSAGMVLIMLLGFTGQAFFALFALPSAAVLTYVPLFFGQVRQLWLPLDFEGAAYIAGLSAVVVITAAFFGDEFHRLCAGMFALLTAFSVAMSLFSRENRHEINFVSSGKSAAALVCMKDEAALLISGSGSGITRTAAEYLRKNGIMHISIISAPEADYNGSSSIAALAELFGAEKIVTTQAAADALRRSDTAAEVTVGEGIFAISGTTLAAAKAGSSCSEDIVLFSGYKRSVPENSAGLAVYFSAAQKLLPENGINIAELEVLTLPLDKNEEVTLTLR